VSRRFKSPWFAVALIAPVYVTTKPTPLALKLSGITMLIGLVYRAAVIWPQKGKAWNLKEPILDEAAHIEVSVKMP